MTETTADLSQQDPEVQSVRSEVTTLLTAQETIEYVAVQGGPWIIGQLPDAVVATNNRLILLRRHHLGRLDVHDYQWQDVEDVSLRQGMTSSDIVVMLADGRRDLMPTVRKDQAQRVYAIAQQMEQVWREKRRIRLMEEERARAGGIVMTMPGTTPGLETTTSGGEGDDHVARLAKAKAMLDQRLITEDEYHALKTRILGSI